MCLSGQHLSGCAGPLRAAHVAARVTIVTAARYGSPNVAGAGGGGGGGGLLTARQLFASSLHQLTVCQVRRSSCRRVSGVFSEYSGLSEPPLPPAALSALCYLRCRPLSPPPLLPPPPLSPCCLPVVSGVSPSPCAAAGPEGRRVDTPGPPDDRRKWRLCRRCLRLTGRRRRNCPKNTAACPSRHSRGTRAAGDGFDASDPRGAVGRRPRAGAAAGRTRDSRRAARSVCLVFLSSTDCSAATDLGCVSADLGGGGGGGSGVLRFYLVTLVSRR